MKNLRTIYPKNHKNFRNSKPILILLVLIRKEYIGRRRLEIVNNNHKIINLHVMLPPKVWQGRGVARKSFLQQFRSVARLPN